MTCNIIAYKENKNAIIPSVAYNGTSAAFDITCVEDTTIKAHSSNVVPNGLRLCIPEGNNYYMTVHLRSSFGFKKDLIPHIGIIDAGYTGPLGIKIYNLGDEDVLIKKGERYAQILVHKKICTSFQEMTLDEFEQFKKTQLRNDKGFGSSNLK